MQMVYSEKESIYFQYYGIMLRLGFHNDLYCDGEYHVRHSDFFSSISDILLLLFLFTLMSFRAN